MVIPCLIELGSEARRVHWELGQLIARTCTHAIVTTREYARELMEGAKAAGMRPEQFELLENTKDIVASLIEKTKEGDVVLFGGRVPRGTVEKFIQEM